MDEKPGQKENSFKPRREIKSAMQAPTWPKIEVMLKECEKRGKAKYKMLISVAWNTALRVKELAGIKVKDFNFVKDELIVRKEICKKPRKRLPVDKIIKINEPEFMNDLQDYIKQMRLNDEDYLFCYGDDRKPYTTRRLAAIIEEIGNWIDFRGLHPHLFRHARAKWLLSKKTSMKYVQELLRHHDASTTINEYARFTRDEINEEAERIPRVWGKSDEKRTEKY